MKIAKINFYIFLIVTKQDDFGKLFSDIGIGVPYTKIP